MAKRGLFAVGRLVSIDQVKYGPNHATKAGEPVVGLYEVKLIVSPEGADEPRFFRASFFDSADGGRSPMSEDLERLDVGSGVEVSVRFGTKVQNGFERRTAYGIEVVDAPKVAAVKTA